MTDFTLFQLFNLALVLALAITEMGVRTLGATATACVRRTTPFPSPPNLQLVSYLSTVVFVLYFDNTTIQLLCLLSFVVSFIAFMVAERFSGLLLADMADSDHRYSRT